MKLSANKGVFMLWILLFATSWNAQIEGNRYPVYTQSLVACGEADPTPLSDVGVRMESIKIIHDVNYGTLLKIQSS